MTVRLARTISFLALAACIAWAQAQPAAGKLPRTADGHPDLQGIWTNATLTPLQRPAELASKAYSDADTILYRATVGDSTVYSKPWTIEVPMTKAKGPLFESACNEGNYGMLGILEGARVEEKAAAKK